MGFSTVPCNEFVEVLGSKAPVPGGGGASALVGAVGTALGNMVGALTVGKKKYADVEEEMKELMAKATTLQDELLHLIERMQKCSNRSPKHTACRARQRRRRQKKQESWRLC